MRMRFTCFDLFWIEKVRASVWWGEEGGGGGERGGKRGGLIRLWERRRVLYYISINKACAV